MENPFCLRELLQDEHSRSAAKNLYSSYIATCVFNAFSSYTAIMLNIVSIHAIRKTSSLPKPLKTLLLSLAVSDLGVGFLVQPFYTASLAKCLLQDHNPSYFNYSSLVITNWFSLTSFLGVSALSADRFFAIHLHLRYQELVTHRRVITMAISIWVFTAVLSLLEVWFPIIASPTIAVFLIVCFISTTFFYVKICSAVRRHANQIRALQVQQVTNNGEMMVNFERVRKSTVGTFYVYLVFWVCYLPHYVTFAANLLLGSNNDLEILSLFTFTLVLLSSSLNPLIYYWKMTHIRRGIIDILRNVSSNHN